MYEHNVPVHVVCSSMVCFSQLFTPCKVPYEDYKSPPTTCNLPNTYHQLTSSSLSRHNNPFDRHTFQASPSPITAIETLPSKSRPQCTPRDNVVSLLVFEIVHVSPTHGVSTQTQRMTNFGAMQPKSPAPLYNNWP